MNYREEQKAFLCGLLSRIGQLVLFTVAEDQYGKLLEASETRFPTAEFERAQCGLSHLEVGRRVLELWNLPEEICQTIGGWGEPVESILQIRDDEVRTLTSIVAVADAVSELLLGHDKGVELERTHQTAGELLHIGQGEIERMIASSECELRETLAIFGDVSGGNIDCEAILEEARQRLILMSIGLASDLVGANQNAAELEQSNLELREKAETDALTGLPNRAALMREAKSIWNVGRPDRQRHFSVIMVDVDHFKMFNDTYGHKIGDDVLVAVGNSLKRAARSTDFVARYGGEEFTVILTNTSSDSAASVAERFRKEVEETVVGDGTSEFRVTASFGVASSDTHPNARSFDEILKAADRALYDAKAQGRNCVRMSKPSYCVPTESYCRV